MEKEETDEKRKRWRSTTLEAVNLANGRYLPCGNVSSIRIVHLSVHLPDIFQLVSLVVFASRMLTSLLLCQTENQRQRKHRLRTYFPSVAIPHDVSPLLSRIISFFRLQ